MQVFIRINFINLQAQGIRTHDKQRFINAEEIHRSEFWQMFFIEWWILTSESLVANYYGFSIIICHLTKKTNDGIWAKRVQIFLHR